MIEYIAEPFDDADLAGYTAPGWYFWTAKLECVGPFSSCLETVRHRDLHGSDS